MRASLLRSSLGLLCLGLMLPGEALAARKAAPPRPARTAVAQPAPTSAVATAPARTAPSPATPTPVRAPRAVVRTGFAPYAEAGPVTLHYPADLVEVVGLHESGHDGAQPQQPVGARAPIGALDSRSRDTNRQGAADVVVDPRGQVRSPVTG